MIVIITGASHTGKTVLAQRMLEKYKYPYVSIAHLKIAMQRTYTSMPVSLMTKEDWMGNNKKL